MGKKGSTVYASRFRKINVNYLMLITLHSVVHSSITHIPFLPACIDESSPPPPQPSSFPNFLFFIKLISDPQGSA